MRSVLTTALLVLVAVAGCTQAPLAEVPAPDTSPPTEVQPLPDLQMDTFMADYKSFVTTYSDRAENVPSHEGARQAMAKTFTDAGLTVWRHNFTDGLEQANIVGIQWGTLRDQWVIVGAHYDTFSDDCIALPEPCPGRKATGGVYDDGSGTAMVLHMAKLFSKLNATYTVAYAAFDGEERGLQGSKALAGAIAEGDTPYGTVTLRAVIDIDMFGLNWPGVNTPIEFLHNHEAMQASMEKARTALGIPDDMIDYGDSAAGGGSDFASFADDWPTAFFSSNMGKQGLPATPAGQTPTSPGVYPFWHLSDTWETLTLSAGGDANLRAGFEVANGLVARLLLDLAFDPAFELEP